VIVPCPGIAAQSRLLSCRAVHDRDGKKYYRQTFEISQVLDTICKKSNEKILERVTEESMRLARTMPAILETYLQHHLKNRSNCD